MTLMDDSFEAFVSSFRLQYPWPDFFVEKLGSVRYFFCQITSVYMKTL